VASINQTKRNGATCWQIWVNIESNRRQIWLGKISKSRANEIYSYVKQLEGAAQTGTSISPLVSAWLDSTSDRFYSKLVSSGLVNPRCSRTIREFFSERLAKLNCSVRTRDIYQRAHDKFYDYLEGKNPLLRDFSPEAAHDFYHVFLVELEIADTYRNKTARIIREFFGKAVEFELINRNPFRGIKISSNADRSRQVMIDRKSIHEIIGKASDIRWRCLLGFAGLCGLRTRSEIAAIRWENVNWDDNTMIIPKGKTKQRTCPIFGDFRPYLEDYHALAISNDPLTVLQGPVFPNCPSQTQLTARLNRTVAKAGLQPWHKPWINLRSSCESHLILVDRFDIETVSAWLGNSPNIVRKHYLQFIGEDIDRAAGVKKFANSLQHTGESGSTPKEKPAFSRMVEHEKAGQYT